MRIIRDSLKAASQLVEKLLAGVKDRFR